MSGRPTRHPHRPPAPGLPRGLLRKRGAHRRRPPRHARRGPSVRFPVAVEAMGEAGVLRCRALLRRPLCRPGGPGSAGRQRARRLAGGTGAAWPRRPPGACGGRRGFPATRPEPIKQRPWSRSLFKPFLGESAAHRGSGTAALGGLMTSMLAPRSIQVLLKCHLLQEALPPYPVRIHRDLAPHQPLFLPDSSCGPRPHQTWPCAYRLTDRPSTSPLAGRLRVYRLLDLFTAVSRLPERCSASSGCVADRCLH